MKRLVWLATAGAGLLTVSLLAHATSASAPEPAATVPSAGPRAAAAPGGNSNDQLFYALGVLLSQNLTTFDLSEHEFRQVLRGFTDGFRHHAKLEDAQSRIPALQGVQRERGLLLMQRQKTAGAAYLAKVAARPGARRTPSGLVYMPVVQGTGAAPQPTDRVTVQYTGKLIDGTVFDSSVRRGKPATLPLVGIIPCWREALQLMKVGGKARVICPSNAAYGDRGRPPVIPPGATLDFQIELLAVMPGPATLPLRPRVR